MPEVNPECFHLSASSISSFKACPTRFRLSYREGLRPDKDTDSQRMGTNWHAMHEVYANALRTEINSTSGYTHEDRATDAVIEHLNVQYAKCPNWKTPTEWAVERQVLFVSFVGYLWFYQNDPIEVLASELAFDLPLHAPKTGMPLLMKEVVRVGKIDHVIRWQGMVGCLERKSTSRGIDSGSDYWDKSKKDTQVSMYALAFRDMAQNNALPEDVWDAIGRTQDVDSVWPRFGNTLYDVWHKPTIKPAMLTQKETAALCGGVDSRAEYCGAEFTVVLTIHPDPSETNKHLVSVDGETCEVEMGKKGFAIRETPGMFGARLLADIYERPDFYYARREIARTDQEITKFRTELFNIYQAMKTFSKTKCWYENESQCRATFPCPHLAICYGPGADAVCDGTTTPQGYKRIFVDLKVNGKDVAED